MKYLMIQNPGVADPLSYTLLGASGSRGSDNQSLIGKFGSGNKYAIITCMRFGAAPVVFAGNLRMDFSEVGVSMNTIRGRREYGRIRVRYSGRHDGKTKGGTEDMNVSTEYGAEDWTSIDMALREFVSNAIDAAIDRGELLFLLRYTQQHGADQMEAAGEALREYRKGARDFLNVLVQTVDESQVRAWKDHTRVFIPYTEEVADFHRDLGKWFLHFSEPGMLSRKILPKANRNLGDRRAAVIYRRGVRVREFESSDTPSLFDYNLNYLALDEARKADDWRIRHAAAQALRDAGPEDLATLFQSFLQGEQLWEHGFDAYGLDAGWDDRPERIQARSQAWVRTFDKVLGEDAVLATRQGGEVAARKGYRVVEAPEAFVKAAGKLGVRTPERVLSQDDRDGREILAATPDAVAALDLIWDAVVKEDMTAGKDKPLVKSFHKIMDGGARTSGFYRDNTVFIDTDIAADHTVAGGAQALSLRALAVMLEEVGHHVTQATDSSRDLQDFVFNLAARLLRRLPS